MLTPDAQQFQRLFAQYTGLQPLVIEAWITCESGGGSELAAPYNFLNVGNPSWSFTSPSDAAARTATELNGGANWSGIRIAISTNNGDAEIDAIIQSPWSEAHYSNGCLINEWNALKGSLTPTSGRVLAEMVIHLTDADQSYWFWSGNKAVKLDDRLAFILNQDKVGLPKVDMTELDLVNLTNRFTPVSA